MLKTGEEHLESLRDGRVVYVGGERIDDVTSHPAFRNGARSMAALYDLKADPANRDLLSFEDDGARHSMHFLMAKNAEDLARRSRAHKAIADLSCGLYGRSPDHVASFVTGLAMKPDVFDQIGPGYGDNIVKYYHYMRDNDIYAAYAVLPPAGARNPEFYQTHNLPTPTLRVVGERDDGVVISGLKMLATGALYANELWIGNLLPLAPNQKNESITCALPCATPGNAMVVCEDVFVPWERVFVHDNAEMSREIYVQTPSHCYGNHQSNVRFWAKMGLMTGVLSLVARSTGNEKIPAVSDMLGRMAALEATIAGMVHGQIQAYEEWPPGYVCFNRRYMYAALNWCTETHPEVIEMLRELTGGSVFQMPADVTVLENEKLRAQFEEYWQTPFMSAIDRMKLLRLAWDLVGSEFAGRHHQYEKFYAGPYFVVRNHSFREADWDSFHGLAQRILDRIEVPEVRPGTAD